MPCPITGHGSSFPEDALLNPPMAYFDREALYTSLPDRVSYLTSFLQCEFPSTYFPGHVQLNPHTRFGIFLGRIVVCCLGTQQSTSPMQTP
jgi:hypothetical protein